MHSGLASLDATLMPLSMPNPDITKAITGWKPESCKTVKKSLSFPLNYSRSDAAQIIEYIGRFALEYGHTPCIVNFARYIIKSVFNNNAQQEQFTLVANFILDNITYVADPRGVEYLRSPIAMIREIKSNGFAKGDCDDMVLFTNSICNALGMRTRVMAVKTDNSENYNHVVSMVEVAGTWKWFDGCNKNDPTKTWVNALMFQL